MSSSASTYYTAFCTISIYVLRAVNEAVREPYMDEPFHVPQAQAYCEGKFQQWDPKLTTPPGLYVLSVILRRIFALKCNLAMLRLTPLLALLSLPLALTRLLCYHQRQPVRSSFTPTPEAIVLACFPIVWFFGFLYYTEVPSLAFVVLTVVAATQDRHWLAALLGAISCTFRQTNIIWVLYAYATSQVMRSRFRRAPSNSKPFPKLHDPPALAAQPIDLLKAVISVPPVLFDLIPPFIPYAVVLAGFAGFVAWNGGIVLGDKSNHIPSFHVPQVYYFIGFSTLLGWPALVTGHGGLPSLIREIWARMFGCKRCMKERNIATTVIISIVMAATIHQFTIHHPFLLSDNRHYTFYVWRRVFLLHPIVPYLLIPGYIACAWAWYVRIGQDQTLLQNLLLPVFVVPTLLPTPLLEPRYFLIPYVLLRAQVVDMTGWDIALEGVWYAAVNAATMWVFLYKERPGVGRFMW